MQKKVILITGAAGEIGQALVQALAESEDNQIITLDLAELPKEQQSKSTHIRGSISDKTLVQSIGKEQQIDLIFHLAALLSTRAEQSPELAHQVNVDGTLHLLELAAHQTQQRRNPVQVIFPSSVAAYGFPDLRSKNANPRVRENEWNSPSTMYGCNKLYGELLGNYYAQHYQQLADPAPLKLDFRALRFPGLISAHTVPSGGTSDYGPEMLHAAAKGLPYACFVRPDTTIPFMAMPDAVKALLHLAAAPREKLSRTAYNVSAFSLSAEEFRTRVMSAFPGAEISYQPHEKRQAIVDSWPMDMDDSAARADWAWSPEYDLQRSFDEYLVPHIRQRYQS
jgi:threonine 3-dehydrogenase